MEHERSSGGEQGTDCGVPQDSAFEGPEMISAKFRAYTHRLYERDGAFYVIGDVRNYPVSFPLYQVSM